MKHYRFFVGHKPPTFKMPPGFTYFGPSAASQIEMAEDSYLKQFGGNILSEYYTLFHLNYLLKKETKPDDLITTYQRRRFLLNRPHGVIVRDQPWQSILKTSEVPTINQNWLAPGKSGFLIPPHHDFGMTVLENYAMVHFARDLLRFVSDLVDEGMLTNATAAKFLKARTWIPCASCSTLPAPVFHKMLDQLEKSARIFLAGGFAPREGYQSRSLGFLLERLQSALIISTVKRAEIDLTMVTGNLVVVSDSLTITPG